MPAAQPLTIGPLTIATIEGDVYQAVSDKLEALESSWVALAARLKTSRQNLQRAMRLQQALKVETLRSVLAALDDIQGVRRLRPRSLKVALAAMGLRVVKTTNDDDRATVQAVAGLTR